MTSAGMSVVLCCADEDENSLAPVVDHLRREGVTARVLTGVERDAGALGRAVDEASGRTLFVLCRSPRLGPGDVLRLEGIFGARKGPLHRMTSVRLLGESSLEIVRGIRSGIAGFGAAARETPEPQAPVREVVAITNLSAVGSDARSAQAAAERAAGRETPADPLAVPLRGKAAEHAARVPPHQSGGWRIDETAREGHRVPAAAAPSGAEPPPPASMLPPPAPPTSRALPMLLGAGVAAVVAILVVVLMRGAEQQPRVVGAASRQAPAASPPEPALPPAEPVRPDPPDPVPSEPAVPEPVQEPTPEPTPEPLSTDDAAIAEAIENGRMRALDLLLVAGLPGEPSAWADASTYCRRKKIAGVGGWRLPSLSELKKLRGARMLRDGRYWSGTTGEPGSEEVWVVDRDARAVELVAKTEADAQPLCVRAR